MKKKLLVSLLLLITGIASAQFTIWEDDFNDSDVSDWTLIDADGDSHNWIPTMDWQIDANNQTINGSFNILGSYNLNQATGVGYKVVQKNWAIAPEIDLSYYASGIQLVVNAQPSILSGNQDIYVYASTTNTDISSFTQIGTLKLIRKSSKGTAFADYTVDLSQFSGQSKVYIAFLTTTKTSYVGLEIDNVKITATTLLGIEDVKNSTTTVLKQNPVEDYLQLQLNSKLNEEQVTLSVYNTTGILVKEGKYNESGLLISNLSAGVYILVVQEGNKIEKIKFIKK
ncbi:T9SS-dependent choice-of-anchor J family protein [Flavobacterium ajazii]|uniref:T9SS-dependent choice-of-anchor J family protein n=1 Tax=Flavobacterium ajazii TaxID=2692318 RepID=UPI0013D01676|nr:choice-of-anchor J domain-containing protein [Flavobacterium ajazii]